MAFSETTTEGYGSRVGGSIKGALFGIILFLAGFPILFMNEGNSVQTAKSLKEGAGAVVSVASDKVDPANEKKPVHISGLVTTEETLADPDFGISAPALKLDRTVEMYQWEEDKETRTKEKAGGTKETVTTYTYEKKWKSGLINSSSFKESGHDNPSVMPYNSTSWNAQIATLGAYTIPDDLVGKMTSSAPKAVAEGEYKVPGTPAAPPKVVGGAIYVGADPAAPKVGDVRISYTVLNPAVASIVARQVGNTLDAYPTKAGKPVKLLQMGEVTAADMFSKALSDNEVMTWVVRFLGFLAMFFGLMMLFGPLVMIARFIPFLGDLLNVGAGIFAGLIAFVFALITIAIAWLVFRPILGIGLIVIAVGVVIAVFVMPARVKIKQDAPGTEPASAGV